MVERGRGEGRESGSGASDSFGLIPVAWAGKLGFGHKNLWLNNVRFKNSDFVNRANKEIHVTAVGNAISPHHRTKTHHS